MKKNRKKRLPKYWLGTRMPASLGYQPNQGAGNVSYTTTPGEDFTPEVDAARKNILPGAINRLQLSTTPLLNMFQNTVKVAAPVASASASTVAGLASNSGKFAGDLASSFGTGTTKYATSFFGPSESGFVGAEAGANTGATASRTALNTAGKALGIVGSAYGLANMAMDFAHNQDHRNVADMWNTVNTNTYTTDKGNTYNTYSAPNLQAELDYASSQKTSRNLNNIINSIGTGAAIGTTIAPGIGTLMGIIPAAAYGLISWIGGFGDTYEDTMNAYRKTQDVASLKSLQSEASAKNKDVRQGFYERSNDGRVAARCGKMSRYSKGKVNAMVSNGETIGKFKDGNPGELEYAYVVPGKVTENTAFADTKKAHVGKDEFVISNKEMPEMPGVSLSQYANASGDYVTPLIIQDMMNRNIYNLYGTLKAKNGKLPKYNLGTALMTAAPNIAQSLAAWMQYNNDRKSTPYAHTTTADYSPAINQGYAMLANKIDKTPYMRMIDNDILKHLWNVRRMPGLGLGGRATLMDSAIIQGAHAKANKALEIDDKNIALDNSARTYIGNMNAHATDVNNLNFHDWAKRYAIATGAYHNNLALGLKNMVMPFGLLMKDLISDYRFDESQKIKNRMIGIYEKGANSKDSEVISDLLKLYNTYNSPLGLLLQYFDSLSPWEKQALYGLWARQYGKYNINGLTVEGV